MTKIGIATLFSDNYGACLQAYALQKVLKNYGFEVEQINYERSDTKKRIKFFSILSLRPVDMINILISSEYRKKRKKEFDLFRNKYLSVTKTKYNLSTIGQLNDKYDFFISGSDMVFSEEFVTDWKFYYLGFAKSEKTIAYAPSFGQCNISAKHIQECGLLLSRFKYLSCREKKGCEFINCTFDLTAIHVCDPTLLLKQDEWQELFDEECPSGYALSYVFGKTTRARSKIFNELENVTHLKFVPQTFGQFKKNKDNISLSRYVTLFKNSSFVITDTFHGLMFSLIFEKPFVVLERGETEHWGKHSDRITSLLNYLGLGNRFINPDKFDYKTFSELNYDSIRSQINKFRDSSLKFLLNSLGGEQND